MSTQIPTIYELVAHEKSFALTVEELFSNVTFPEYRQMIIEVINCLDNNVCELWWFGNLFV